MTAPVPQPVARTVAGDSALGLAVVLPRSRSLTETLTTASDRRAGALPPDLRASLAAELAASASGLEEHVVLDAYRLGVALEHPEEPGHQGLRQGPFVHSVRGCRRAVGLAAVAVAVRRRDVSPAVAVAEVLEAGVADAVAGGESGSPPAPWWAAWFAQLPAAGRAVVHAEAATWATQLWTALDWRRFERAPQIGGRDDRWQCPEMPQLTLKGRADVRVRAEERVAFLVVRSDAPGRFWGAELGLAALVVLLARGAHAVPARVVGWWPACGQVRRLEVTAEALQSTVAATARAIGVLTSHGPPSTTTGARPARC